jgi:hypothetical protein
LIIKTSYANIYKQPTFESELVTQGLIWDEIELVDKKDNWYRVRQWDDYIGWIHRFYVSEEEKQIAESYFRVPVKSMDVYTDLQGSNDVINQVLFGSYIPIKLELQDGLEIYLPENKTGHIKNISEQKSKNSLRDAIIKKSKMFLGVPYLWGGSSACGVDCSGFIQAIFKYFGINFDRDTSLQINNNLIYEIDHKNINKADLIYFYIDNIVNHVGLIIDNKTIIHSSGSVVIEGIDDVINRLNSDKGMKVSTKLFTIGRLIENKVNYDR